jgi:hypothetical protein
VGLLIKAKKASVSWFFLYSEKSNHIFNAPKNPSCSGIPNNSEKSNRFIKSPKNHPAFSNTFAE